MNKQRVISSRGVYYDLTKSPYEFITPYGDFYKFSSEKKLEIYKRDIPFQLKQLNRLLDRHDLKDFIPPEIVILLERAVYESFYKKIEG